MRRRCCDAAAEVLWETGNPAVMCGDKGLLHLIAERMGWEHKAWKTSDRVLRVLAKTPGPLVKRYTRVRIGPSERRVLCFWLPEEYEKAFRCEEKCTTATAAGPSPSCP